MKTRTIDQYRKPNLVKFNLLFAMAMMAATFISTENSFAGTTIEVKARYPFDDEGTSKTILYEKGKSKFLDEGTETRLEESVRSTYMPFYKNIPNLLNKIHKVLTTSTSQAEAKKEALRLLEETLSEGRNIDDKAILKIILKRGRSLILKQMDPHEDPLLPNSGKFTGFLDLLPRATKLPGTLDQEIRVLYRTVALAKGWEQLDKQYPPQKGNENTPYEEFGFEYSTFLMDISESVLNARVQYDLAKTALGQFHVDLTRNASYRFADIVANVALSLDELDRLEREEVRSKGFLPDSFCISKLRKIRGEFDDARETYRAIVGPSPATVQTAAPIHTPVIATPNSARAVNRLAIEKAFMDLMRQQR